MAAQKTPATRAPNKERIPETAQLIHTEAYASPQLTVIRPSLSHFCYGESHQTSELSYTHIQFTHLAVLWCVSRPLNFEDIRLILTECSI